MQHLINKLLNSTEYFNTLQRNRESGKYSGFALAGNYGADRNDWWLIYKMLYYCFDITICIGYVLILKQLMETQQSMPANEKQAAALDQI